MAFERGKFKPEPAVGDLVVGDGPVNEGLGIVEVVAEEMGTFVVECNDGSTRHVIPQWTTKDEEEGTVEENFWWQDCASRAVPWFE